MDAEDKLQGKPQGTFLTRFVRNSLYSFLIRLTCFVFRLHPHASSKTPVLTFVSAKKIMNCFIEMEDGMFWINKSNKYPSFPALVDSCMNKKNGDDYYLLTGLFSRDQSRSLPWYHGKLNNTVYYILNIYICFYLIYQVKWIKHYIFKYHCQSLCRNLQNASYECQNTIQIMLIYESFWSPRSF